MHLLTVDDVVQLHDLRVPHAPLIDRGKLDSALHRPQQYLDHEPGVTIHHLAAVMVEGICQAHAFEDGNKRAALLAVYTFYALNEYYFDAPDGELLHLMVDLTTHDISATKAADLFGMWAQPVSYDED